MSSPTLPFRAPDPTAAYRSDSVRRSHWKTALLAFLTASALAASGVKCIDPGDQSREYGELVKSDRARDLHPSLGVGDLAELAAGNTAFAFDLYHELSGAEGNLFCSPFSISLALAMTYAGARGDTAQQMADTLHFTLAEEDLHPAFNALDLELASRGQGAAGADGDGFRLNIANAIWGQQDYTFLTDYLDVLAVNYGAGLRALDFIADAESARVTINDWVADETEDRIEDLLPPGSVNALTRLVLTNAVYFNAAWMHPFSRGYTQSRAFHRLDGSTVNVPTMDVTEMFGYGSGDGYLAVELPYDGGELSMIILMPDAGTFDDFESDLDAAGLAAIVDDLGTESLHLRMPKFTFESEFGLAGTLASMGMPDAFSPAVADLSGIDGVPGNLYISDVVHKAWVKVDEAGTEAAAATGVIIGVTAAPPPPIDVTIDRPFIFLIRDIATDTVLFLGRVTDPS